MGVNCGIPEESVLEQSFNKKKQFRNYLKFGMSSMRSPNVMELNNRIIYLRNDGKKIPNHSLGIGGMGIKVTKVTVM